MMQTALPAPSPLDGDALDRLFLDCAALETLVASIRHSMDALDPAVSSGLVTAEHLMNLAFRIENAERGLIAVAHQIDDTAMNVIRRCRTTGAHLPSAHVPPDEAMTVAQMQETLKN